jgi:hypothetical protein
MVGQRAYWNPRRRPAREVREAEVLSLVQRQLRYAFEHHSTGRITIGPAFTPTR